MLFSASGRKKSGSHDSKVTHGRQYKSQLKEKIQITGGNLQRTIQELKASNDSLRTANKRLTETNERLAKSKEHYRQLVETTKSVPWESDIHFYRYTYIGPQALDVFGFPIEDWYKERFRESCIHPDDRKHVVEYSRQKISQQQDFEIEYRIIAAEGKVIYVRNLVTLVKSHDVLSSLRGLFVDVTESKLLEQEKLQLERQLRHSQKMEAIGVLAGGIAHDFNNLLTAIVGFATVGLKKLPSTSPVTPNLQGVLAAGARARELVRQILLFGKREEGITQLVDVTHVADEAIKMLRASIPRTIEIRKSVDADQAKLMADPSHVHQLIMNLCTNAYQAIGNKPGSIEIRIARTVRHEETLVNGTSLAKGEYIRLSVKDSGCGMDQETLNRIFEPFYTTKNQEGGSGMGLPLVQGIVAQYSGAIEVESVPQQGTTFTILMPRYEEEVIEIDIQEKQTQKGSGRVMFIDDETMLADLGKEILSDLGYTVTTFTDSSEALEEFRKHSKNYDLIITDLTMPTMTGMQVAQLARETRPDIPVILATGYMRDVTSDMLSQNGIHAFLSKPYTLDEIGQVIWRTLHPNQAK